MDEGTEHGVGGFIAGIPDDPEERERLARAIASALLAPHDDDCGGQCRFFRPGHLMHYIQARLAGEQTPWYDVTLEASPDQSVTLRAEDREWTVWHHKPWDQVLDGVVQARFEPLYHVLRVGNRFICVRVDATNAPEPVSEPSVSSRP